MAENKAKDLAGNEAIAQAKNIRMTAMKVRRVVDMVRGQEVEQALDTLRFAPYAAAEPVFKCVASAAANARNNRTSSSAASWSSARPMWTRARP